MGVHVKPITIILIMVVICGRIATFDLTEGQALELGHGG